MQARLKVLHDKANVKQVKLLPVTLIGRSTECNLKIASSQVSRNHCRITLADDAVFVEDLGSANGTLVDGQPIPAHQPTAIAPGTHIIVGPAEFQIDFVAPTSQTLVLNRTTVPAAPELPSTEMIFPTPSPLAGLAVAEQAPAVPQVVAAAMEVAAPVVAAAVIPAPVETAYIPQAPVAAEWQQPVEFVAPVVEQPIPAAVVMPVVETVPVAVVAAMPIPEPIIARAPDTEILDSGAQPFSIETDEEAEQATQFMFAETIPDSIPFDASSSPKSEAPAKKGGLKSLFSLFGRKDKSAGATHSASVAPEVASAPPSVFLPTVEPQVLPEEQIFNVEQPVAEIASSTDTAEITGSQAQPASEETNDDFEQFLAQF